MMLDRFQLQDKLRRVQRQLQGYTDTTALVEQETLVRFFVRIVPELFRAERCGIFFIDPHRERMWSKYGTEHRMGSWRSRQGQHRRPGSQDRSDLRKQRHRADFRYPKTSRRDHRL